MSQLRKWDDQGCLPWLVKCSYPRKPRPHLPASITLRSSGHRGPHPSLPLCSVSWDESAQPSPKPTWPSPLVPAGP